MKEMLELSRSLSDAGYKDILFLDLEDAGKVLTQKRLELIEEIKKGDIESIRDLGRKLERKENVVYNDLELLFEEGIIDFKQEKNRKIPVLRHENIFVKPLSLKNSIEPQKKRS